MKLKTGDQILVTVGKDKGRKGKVEKVFPKENTILVPGVNIYKRARKGFGGQKGGLIEFSRPLGMGKVALLCPKCDKPTRVGTRVDKKGEKSRICKKCGFLIEITGGKK